MKGKSKAKKQTEAGPANDKPSAKKPFIDAALFVAYWNSAETIQALSEKIGLSAGTCANYAARLRKAGHEFKEFARGRPRLLKI